MTLPRGAMGLSAVCDCGISHYYLKRSKVGLCLMLVFGWAHPGVLLALTVSKVDFFAHPNLI